MKIVDLLRLLRKHLVLLLLTPIILAGLVILFTKDTSLTYSSETTLYTGIASGSSVEMDKSLSFFATNTAFDNLINVIKSRETQEEVSIRLLAQHLMLPKSDPRYISRKSFNYLRKITPAYVMNLVIKPTNHTLDSTKKIPIVSQIDTTIIKRNQNKIFEEHVVADNETLYSISQQTGVSVDQISDLNGLIGNKIRLGQSLRIREKNANNSDTTSKDSPASESQKDSISTFSFSNLDSDNPSARTLPLAIDQSAYEQTVKNLIELVASNDTNFVYNLLNYENPEYSVKAISTVTALRIGSSDLVKLKYTTDDPGICQQTLALLTEVCIKKYKAIKENRSDAVVKYFEFQVNQATHKLNMGEDKLLAFNKGNNIINYYEQSKAVALAKEALDVDYNNMRIKLAGTEAAIKRLEEKLENQQKVQLKSAPILEKRNQLSQINTKIATAEIIGSGSTFDMANLVSLKASAEKLKEEIRTDVGDLYHLGNTTEGLPVSTLLNDWINNIISYEDTKAGLTVLAKRIEEFQKQYEIYAPAGANLKRIEREISVSEQEFLELLHGLNLAKLKMQDIELSSNLKPVDQPFYPLTPNPTKRKILVVIALLFGFLTVLSTILALEFFDGTLRNPQKAAKILNILPLGIFPKIYLKPEVLNFSYIAHRLLEMMVQQIELLKKGRPESSESYQIIVFSTAKNEGKTVIARNLASKLKKLGNKVILISYSQDSLNNSVNQNYNVGTSGHVENENNQQKGFSLVNWLLGYSDPRVDYLSPFVTQYGSALLENESYIYKINEEYHPIKDYKELLMRNNYYLSFVPDYVLVEIPPILNYPYPTGLIGSVDLLLMVCRANREWSQADHGALDNISKITTKAPLFVLNGVELDVIESLLGDLPKKRSWFRRITKKIVRFQFFATSLP